MFDMDSLDLSKLTKEEIIEGAKNIVLHVNARVLAMQEEVDNALDIVSMLVRKAGGSVTLSAEEQALPGGQLLVKKGENDSVNLTFAVKLIANATVTDSDATGEKGMTITTPPSLLPQ